MKRLLVLALCVLLANSLFSQTLIEKICIKASEYLENVDDCNNLQDSMKTCIPRAISFVFSNCSEEDKMIMDSAKGIKNVLSTVYKSIPLYSSNVRNLTSEINKKKYYQLSISKKANEFLDKGDNLMKNKKYRASIKYYRKALREDKTFVIAFDNMAIAYRKLEKYKKSLRIYKKSLDIFPAGDVALLNSAFIYSKINMIDEALVSYKRLRYHYPYSAEGFFGCARLLVSKGDYEDALNNLFYANAIYVNEGSSYQKDSSALIQRVYLLMKKAGKLDLFMKIAKENNISIEEE
ncbi:MAG: hypothetical protein WBG43_11110 [Marinifilaceae bacterium]